MTTMALTPASIKIDMTLEAVLNSKEVRNILNGLSDSNKTLCIEAISKGYNETVRLDNYLGNQDRSTNDLLTKRNMLKEKIVPKRLSEKLRVEVESNSVVKTVTWRLFDILRAASKYAANDVWSALHRGTSSYMDDSVATCTYEIYTARVLVISKRDSTVRIEVQKTNSTRSGYYFVYPNDWSRTAYSSPLSCRGSHSTSIDHIAPKIEKYIDLKNENAMIEKTKEAKKAEMFAIIKEKLGSDDVKTSGTTNYNSGFTFWIGENHGVKYVYREGKISLYYISSEILSKLDPVLAMTLFR